MSVIELQLKVSSFLDAQLSALRASPRCLPPPVEIAGRRLQVQGIEFGANAIRHDKPATFGVFYHSTHEGAHPVGTDTPAEGFQTQIAQELSLHVADADDILALDEAVRRLEQQDAGVAAVVRLRFYAGLSVDETAAALGTSPRTVKRDWAFARAWLLRALGGTAAGGGGGGDAPG